MIKKIKITTKILGALGLVGILANCGTSNSNNERQQEENRKSDFSLEEEVIHLAEFAKKCGMVIPNKTCEPELEGGYCVGYTLKTKPLPYVCGKYDNCTMTLEFTYIDGEEGSLPNGFLDKYGDWICLSGEVKFNKDEELIESGWAYPAELGLKHDNESVHDTAFTRRIVAEIKANLDLEDNSACEYSYKLIYQ